MQDSVKWGDVTIDASDNLTFDNLNIGMSVEVHEQYITDLLRLIEELRDEFKNLSDVSNAINNGWAGQAKVNFLEDLAYSVNEIIALMDVEKDDLVNRLAELKSNYSQQDEEMITW